MRYKDFKIKNPEEELAKKLPKLTLTDYDTIDELMQKISKRHKITGKKLHDLFVHKYGHTPDVWIKKIKQRNEEVNESAEETYILYINDKPVSKYNDLSKAEMDANHLLKKFPDSKIYIAVEVCDIKPISMPKKKVYESLIDLTKNFQKYDTVIGKVLEKKPNGKVSIKIVSLSPDTKGSLQVGQVISLNQHYLKNLPMVNESVESAKDIKHIKKFLKWSINKLNISKPYPKIILSRDTEKAKEGTHTGYHTEDPGRKTIWIYIENRNLIDIFRTLFHELVHEKQSQLDMIQDGDSYPGSPIEAMADMIAGKYIKIYGKQHPEIFQ